ncbi:MAG: hypothetical protein WDA16_08805 [Candidatus Thermoplasmatota archaeon]
MTRTWTDLTLGIAAGVLLATVAGGFFVTNERAACYAAQVEASAWTSGNTQPFPAAMLPNCSPWESALMILASIGTGALAGVIGLGILRARAPMRPGAA